jgi:hypothetical protein
MTSSQKGKNWTLEYRNKLNLKYIKSIQKSKNHQRRFFLDNYYRQRCLV